jgi:glycosyltransferase involved in cell wall biosynthesis
MTCCVVIPVYNHGAAVGAVVENVQKHGLHCIVIDDGSESGCAAVLDQLVARDPFGRTLLRLATNQGKGGAMLAGMRLAHRMGYSHALQIDADGQHKCSDIPSFVALAETFPERVICGCPVYDETVPKVRLYGRYATHILVWLNTLSFDIRDSMCGFRVYPLGATMRLINSVRIGQHMDFDIDIVVRLYWDGVLIVNRPTGVTYPADGVSHYRMWRDNVLIARLHTALFLGMLLRAPRLISRKFSGMAHA